MDNKYSVQVTSRDSSDVNDILISPPDDEALTRRIARAKIVNNVHEPAASVQVTLRHQRRHRKDEPWQDADSFNLGTLKAGQEMRLELDTTETLRLKEALVQIYALGHEGVPARSSDYVAVPAKELANAILVKGRAREAVEALERTHGTHLWEAVAELAPDVISTLALKRLNDKRRKAVSAFRKELDAGTRTEVQWQRFFERNLWIFGHGLDFRFCKQVEEQPHYGGTTVTGKGAQRGDYLLASQAAPGTGASFTVLLDIKTPQALLVEKDPYRSKVHRVGPDVTGGLAQLQSYCRTWVTEGARQEENAQKLNEANIYTYEPKAILVIGDTRQLDTTAKKASFEMFRRNLHNPAILTFDELLARSQWIVEHGDPPASTQPDVGR